MSALRLGRREDQTEKRKMGLLRLGRSQDPEDIKRSMGLLRLGWLRWTWQSVADPQGVRGMHPPPARIGSTRQNGQILKL